MVRSIVPKPETIRGAQRCSITAAVFGARVAETISASGHGRPHPTGRTYGCKRSDQNPRRILQAGGRPHMGTGFRRCSGIGMSDGVRHCPDKSCEWLGALARSRRIRVRHRVTAHVVLRVASLFLGLTVFSQYKSANALANGTGVSAPAVRGCLLVWAIYGNGAVMPGQVNFEMHARCHQRRHAGAARPVFKGYNAELRKTLQGAG